MCTQLSNMFSLYKFLPVANCKISFTHLIYIFKLNDELLDVYFYEVIIHVFLSLLKYVVLQLEAHFGFIVIVWFNV